MNRLTKFIIVIALMVFAIWVISKLPQKNKQAGIEYTRYM